MSDADPVQDADLWSRQPPERTGPNRRAGGVYRTAEGKDRAFGGIPLQTANDAVVAAVRLAYKVAEAQIDRSTRLANRLRQAGDRAAGPHSDRQALDATEKLVMNALLSGLAWWEGSVAEGRCPVKRLAAAEYQMLGSILGLGPKAPAKGAAATQPAAPSDATVTRSNSVKGAAAAAPSPRTHTLQIKHKGDKSKRRPVLVESWEFTGPSPFETEVYLYSVDTQAITPLEATLNVEDARAYLTLGMPRSTKPHRWKAVICDEADFQVGYIEIVL